MHAADAPIIIAARNQDRLRSLADRLSLSEDQVARIDIKTNLREQLTALAPFALIHTAGPFQGADYSVAKACIETGTHYIDLADGRDFVRHFEQLDDEARAKGLSLVTGASTVPTLSSAVVEYLLPHFKTLRSLRYGITVGQQTPRGLATTQGILSYAGKRLEPTAGSKTSRYGWQNLHRQHYPGLDQRWMATCDIPDLDLFPVHYPIGDIQFSAGLELSVLHLGLWALSGIRRALPALALERFTASMLAASNLLNDFGSADGGMHVIAQGEDVDGKPIQRRWFLIVRNGDGPFVPTIPAVVLAKRLLAGEQIPAGANPCMGMISLATYLDALSDFNIEVVEDSNSHSKP